MLLDGRLIGRDPLPRGVPRGSARALRPSETNFQGRFEVRGADHSHRRPLVGCFENRQQVADTRRTHQNRHARRLATHLRSFERRDLQENTEAGDQAAGLCKRASLVLPELLYREGIEDAELWHLGMAQEGSGFASSDEHYVVVIGAEAIDATARQFDQASDPITRRSLKEVSAPWHTAQPVRIGYVAVDRERPARHPS